MYLYTYAISFRYGIKWEIKIALTMSFPACVCLFNNTYTYV